MRLHNSKYNFEINFSENTVNVLCVENPFAYREMISDIWSQVNGNDGTFSLYDVEKEKYISKEMVCIFNPFALECNEKKILNKVYLEMKQLLLENFNEKITGVNSSIIDLMDEAISLVPYNLEYDYELDINDIFKILNVRFDSSSTNVQDGIVDYMKIMHQVCRVDIFFFVNLKQYFTAEELEMIYQAAFYEKVFIITLESSMSKRIKSEKHLIIDEDLCIIELDMD